MQYVVPVEQLRVVLDTIDSSYRPDLYQLERQLDIAVAIGATKVILTEDQAYLLQGSLGLWRSGQKKT